jgi:membrane protease YdiL (CAAX protease family)
LARDLLLYFAVTALGVVHFVLKTKGTAMESVTMAFALMWVMSLALLMMLRIYGGPSGQHGDIVDYDENLEREHLPILLGSVAAIAVVNILLVRGFAKTSIYVPKPSLSQVTTFAPILDDVLYNLVLVAPAEECVKLMAILTIYRKTRNEIISVAVPVGVWAISHAYLAYLGANMPVLVVSAFLSGIILYLVLKYTESLLNAIIAHSLYNILVLFV